MGFAPIAVVGAGCVLPDALDPAAYWRNVAAGRVSLSSVPPGRWGVPVSAVLGGGTDRARTDRGGYVRGFDEAFDPEGFLLPAETVAGLDRTSRWVLHAARQALSTTDTRVPAGMVLGNLSLPSPEMARYAQDVWLPAAAPRPDPGNRFFSTLPARVAARALGLAAGAFTLDAACASALYATKLACDRLHDGRAGLMLAGGVNGADDLFLHIGFSALSALSPSGRSRPFHPSADGLVPAEGAVLLALMRLDDAVGAGVPVLGVIRGIGLSNDGRTGGPLAPARDGQVRAMRAAYASAGLDPAAVSLVECHATGTTVGDAVELSAMAEVFGGATDLVIGSVKANIGHPVTAAGAAGVLKVLGAMAAGIRPATPGTAGEAGENLRLPGENEPWPGQRTAAVSAFGFGGNNAHLVLEAWEGRRPRPAPSTPAAEPVADPVAIVAVGARVADGAGVRDLTDALLSGTPRPTRRTDVAVDPAGLRIPPTDLADMHAQQLLVLEAAREAACQVRLPGDRTLVLVGMGCDPEVARHHARWRVAAAGPEWTERARAAFGPSLTASRVLGTLPNLVANRINTVLDLTGPGFTVSADEASGLVAVDLAARALRANEADAAVVGAVDLSAEPVHMAALAELGQDRPPGDAAVVVVLKRQADAHRDGDNVIALLDETDALKGTLGTLNVSKGTHGTLNVSKGTLEASATELAGLFGTAHAAAGLVSLVSAALALRHRARLAPGVPAGPLFDRRHAEVTVAPLDAPVVTAGLRAGRPAGWVGEPVPRPHVYSGLDAPAALAAAVRGEESDEGPARLVVLAADAGELTARVAAARRWLADGGVRPEGVAFRARPVGGDVAFVYTNGSAAYPGMGRELMLAFPEIMDELNDRCGDLSGTVGWAYGDESGETGVLGQIWGASLLGQLHTEITTNRLGLRPAAVLGYSSGESAALVAMRAWRDVPALVADIGSAPLFTSGLVGELRTVRAAWRRAGITGHRWSTWLVTAPAGEVEALVERRPGVYLMAVNAPDVCVVGGEAAACTALVAELGPGRAVAVPYEIAVHAPVVREVAGEWRRLHRRPTHDVPGVRFYSGATGEPYHLDEQGAADAITAQAVGTIRFDRVVARAWADGVRVFVEHGPGAQCTGWVRRVLGDREHLAIAMDTGPATAVRQLTRVAAELLAAGVPVAAGALLDHLATLAPQARERRAERGHDPERAAGVWTDEHGDPCATKEPRGLRAQEGRRREQARERRAERGHDSARESLTFPAHPPAVRVPAPEPEPATMAPAPALPPAHEPGHRIRPRDQVAPSVPVAKQGATGTDLAALHAATTAHRRALTSALHTFLTAHADSHRRFLAGRGRAVALLAGTTARPGPRFDRAQLERLASGPVSELFGPRFAAQDGHPRQTRMPRPPMLLADRVTGIDAAPASMGTGTIWTETDVTAGAWYLDPCGRMPAGLLVEAGQADLLLISWLGCDLDNRGERVYRLLGCELTFHQAPPAPGTTLEYEIHIDGHGEHDGVRLFFFHYDCRAGGELVLTVRGGQAGFFTDAELASAGGVLWDPAAETPPGTAEPAVRAAPGRHFGSDAVRAFAAGRPWDCFGPHWDLAKAHVRTPRIADDRLLLLDEVSEWDPEGGPWGRGYLRAELPIGERDWFFDGHFQDDPCMPGTLMLEGCLQAMAFHLTALGHTVDRDGWRFEPVPGAASQMVCRGQVTPRNRLLCYEVFVADVSTVEGMPAVTADVLCTVDGVRAFLARGLALRLVPDWPLEHWRHLGPPATQETGEPVPLADLGGLRGLPAGDRFAFPALLASAWGRPSEAFGATYARFDGVRRAPRLPGPPYHFVSRVTGMRRDGTTGAVDAEYDVPDRAWYFEQGGTGAMPFAVLMEIALQPCGWLAAEFGCALDVPADVLFRNLDGSATVTGEVRPGTRVVHTHAELLTVSRNADTTIVSFAVRCVADGEPVLEMSTVFGFFPPAAFGDVPGLPGAEEPRGGPTLTVTRPPAGPMLRMVDRVTGYWPDGGAAGLGRLVAELDVDPGAWYFAAHFFQDPVQPGSLGVEAALQLLRIHLTEQSGGTPRFEPVLRDQQVSWRYRGQVVPTDRLVTIELDVVASGPDHAVADAWLWVDGTRIYQVTGLGLRMVPDESVLDPAVDTWLADHRPTWTVPALPMMSTVDLLAQAASRHTGEPVTGLRDVRLRRWVPVPGPVRLHTDVTGGGEEVAVMLLVWREAATAALSRFEPVATARVLVGTPRPAPSAPPVPAAVPDENPYASGVLFHGPSFQHLVSLHTGADGACGVLDAAPRGVPRGALHQSLLDAATHVIPHDRLWLWSAEIGRDVAGFPNQVTSLDVFAPLPDSGQVDVAARFAGFDAGDRTRPAFDVTLSDGERTLLRFRLVDALVPKGRVAAADPGPRRAFLRDRLPAGGLGLSATDGPVTVLSISDVEEFDWLAGTVAHLYGLPPGTRDPLAAVAVRDHVGRHAGVHPSAVEVSADLTTAWPRGTADTYRLAVDRAGDRVTVRTVTRPAGEAAAPAARS